MAVVNLWIAIDERGRGAIGLDRAAVVAAVGNTPRIATARFASWSLTAARLRGDSLPLQFNVENRDRKLRERRRW
jgi:hypothetical protein